METKLNILILEHDTNDLELLQYQLKKSDLIHMSEVVQTREEYISALQVFKPDIILSDYSLPTFDGLSAFKIRQEIAPEVPFIIVSGTIGEENAVELIKMGITDYALKDKMYQVITKIKRALSEANDRKQKIKVEQQLKQREEHLQKIMDLSLDVICTLDKDGNFVTVGAASKYVWGYSPEELVGRQLMDLVCEEDKDATFHAIVDLKSGFDIINLENRILRKDGETVTTLWSARWDSSEKLGYSVARDATEIKKAQEKIRNNEKRFQTLLQNSNEGLALLSADGEVIELSPSAIKILGLTAKEASGKLLTSDLVHPEDLPILEEAFNRAKNNHLDVPTVEYRLYMPDGGHKWIEATIQNQLKEPAVEANVIIFRDITERKLSEIALQESEEKYRGLFNLSPTSMWVYDTKTHRFLDVNEAAISTYGYSKEDFLAMTLKDVWHEEDLEEMKEAVDKAAREGGFCRYVSRHIKKSGDIIFVDIQCNSIEQNNNDVRIVLATDISERVKYIQEIEEQNVKLREIAWIQSHVVRAPLARMMGLVKLLDNHSPEKVSTTNVLKCIATSADELDGIIRDIVRKTEQVDGKPMIKERQLEQ